MRSIVHTYKDEQYVVEREVRGWRTCHVRKNVETGLAWTSEWLDTREKAVRVFKKWVDSTVKRR